MLLIIATLPALSMEYDSLSGPDRVPPEITEPEDTIIDLLNLPPYSTVAPKIEEHHEYGLFPTVGPTDINYFFIIGGGDNWDFAHNLRSQSLLPTTNSFSGINPYDNDELERRKAYTQTVDEEYRVTGNGVYGFGMKTGIPGLPMYNFLDLYLVSNTGLLYTKDKSKCYLNYRGEKVHFTEGGVVTLNEWLITVKYGLMIPFYGVVYNLNGNDFNYFYYISVAPVAALSIYSSGEQYMQIMNAKDDLRYDTGRDVLYLQKHKVFETLNRIRYYANVSLGLELAVSHFCMNAELYCDYPLNSVFSDAWWGQMKFGFLAKFGGH